MAQTTTRPANDNIGRLQQEAMARMMEMQQQAGTRGGWSTDPNVPRQNRAPRREQPEPPSSAAPLKFQTPPRTEGDAFQNNQNNHARGHANNQRRPAGGQSQQQRRPHAPDPEPEQAPQKKSDTTLLQDILNAIGLDDDRVLILGLILILINSKADTTLILALCYLLL